MRDWKKVFAISMYLIALVIEGSAQYRLATRGETNPFDSAVIVRLDRYRAETLKFELADKLIDSLNFELRLTTLSLARRDTAIANLITRIAEQGKTIDRQQITISDLNYNIQRVLRMSQGKTILGKLLRKREFWFGAGALTAILISK